MDKLIGSIITKQNISGDIICKRSVTGTIVNKLSIVGTIDMLQEADPYTETYDVIPTVNGKTLDTSDKVMKRDVLVHPIPYAEVTNPSGGTTVNIAFM